MTLIIFFVYNRKKQSFLDSESLNFGPYNLKGLSGGGIWENTSLHGKTIFRLSGIMIEERVDRGFIIGTRTFMIINLINEMLSEYLENPFKTI